MTVYHPRAVHARIASGCNLSCGFCERELLGPAKKRKVITFGDGRTPLDMSSDMGRTVWDAIAEKLMPHTANMELGGLGEPTLSKLFPFAAKAIVAAGKNLFFFTNGHYLGQKFIIDSVGESPRLSVSIDAGTPEAYARVRGGDLGKVIEGVETFAKAVPGARLNSQFTATADNIDELPAFTRLCARLGIGRTDRQAEIVVVGADHHVTDRMAKSVRFCRDRARRAVTQARAIAEAEGLWLIDRLPPSSESNPNAIDDGSDPRSWRRYTDLLYGDFNNPCTEPPIDPLGAAHIPDVGNMVDGRTIAPRELYVDHTGQVWSCLARHLIGDVKKQGWKEIVEENDAYQEWLANWHRGQANHNSTCMTCPRNK
jgi:MoaA/NifB/PqqE/SkfB family radical SAM enzyme